MTVRALESVTISELTARGAELWPDAPAVAFPGVEWTYTQLHAESVQVARALIALGVRPGDHVGVLLPNGPDFLRAFFGASLAGAVVVTLNIRYRREDLAYVLGHADLRALVLGTQHKDHFDFEPLVDEIVAAGTTPLLEHVVVLGEGGTDLAPLVEQVGEEQALARARAAGLRHPGVMLFTSGTTAAPKAAVLSHEAMVRTALAWGRESLGMGPDDTIWIPNPLFHIGALSTLLASVASGARFLSMPFFEPDGAVRMLTDDRVTLFFPVFDAVALPILEHPDAGDIDWSGVRMSFCIGNPANVRRVKEALPGARHMNTYGMTETAGWCVLNFDDEGPEDPLGGGRPVPGVEFRIRSIGEESSEAAVKELGIIEVRSWCTLTEYYKDADATARAIDAAGWFDTGDLGVRLPDGSLRWRGRSGERMKVGGENVAPMEIEKHLGLHPGIRQCAVVGVPDERLGEVPAAFVELFPGVTVSEEEIVGHCQGAIARFKVPRYVRFVRDGEWPMSTTKIRKGDLRERLIEELALTVAEA